VKKEFLSILAQLEREKGLDRAVIIEAVKHALIIAAKKITKSDAKEPEVRVDIDPSKGDISVPHPLTKGTNRT